MQSESLSFSRPVFGSLATLRIAAPVGVAGLQTVECANDLLAGLHSLELLTSADRPDSEISRIRNGSLALDDASGDVRLLLGLAEHARYATGGHFDIRCGADLDPSGLVKGWAGELVSGLFAARTATSHSLSIGGDVRVRTFGADPTPLLGIAHPTRSGEVLCRVAVRNGALATSGTVAQGLHVWAADGDPASELLSATVVGPSLLWADVLATAAVAAGTETGLALIEQSGDFEAVLVTADEQIVATRGLDALIPDQEREAFLALLG